MGSEVTHAYGRITLDVRYGDWAVVKEFRR